jgi:predicted transcriptional regulator
MFTRILNWFTGVERHAVDVIVADFHKVVDRLKASAEKHAGDAVEAAKEAVRYNEIAQVANAEAQRASAIAANVEALVTPRG